MDTSTVFSTLESIAEVQKKRKYFIHIFQMFVISSHQGVTLALVFCFQFRKKKRELNKKYENYYKHANA